MLIAAILWWLLLTGRIRPWGWQWLGSHYRLWRACRNNDPRQAASVLAAWVRFDRNECPPLHPLALVKGHHDPSLRRALAELDQALYGRPQQVWEGRRVCAELRTLLSPSRSAGRGRRIASSLPSLWLES